MFEFYYSYGLHPVKIDSKVYLELDKNMATDAFLESLNDWCDEYEAFQSGKISKVQFIDWMLKYPALSKNFANHIPREKWLNDKK